MRLVCLILLCGLLFAIGCGGNKTSGPSAAGGRGAKTGDSGKFSSVSTNLIVTPSGATSGKVAFVNGNARYAVLSFPIGMLPPPEVRFNVYRNGLKVGEVKVTGPHMDNNTVGDITVGEARVGDDVRDN